MAAEKLAQALRRVTQLEQALERIKTLAVERARKDGITLNEICRIADAAAGMVPTRCTYPACSCNIDAIGQLQCVRPPCRDPRGVNTSEGGQHG